MTLRNVYRPVAVFSQPPREGHYSEFVINGRFRPTTSAGNNIDFDFVDKDGGTLTSDVIITNATDTRLTGYVRWGNLVNGKGIHASMVHTDLAQTRSAVTGIVVGRPAAPRIRAAVLSPAYEGTSGATLTLYGSDLAPGTQPVGASALTYTYSIVNSGDANAFSGVSVVSATKSQVVISLNILANTAGLAFGVVINYLGGNSLRFLNLGNIQEEPVGTPTITGVDLYAEGALPGSGAPGVAADRYAMLRISGTLLGSTNVDPGGLGDTPSKPGVYLEIVGEEADGITDDIVETPPGPGISAEAAVSRLEVEELVTQSSTEIVARVKATVPFSNLRARVWLRRPDLHTQGPGEWDLALVDATNTGTARGLVRVGTTVRFGAHRRGTKINTDAEQGVTQLDVARSLQSQCGPATSGNLVTLTVRLKEAITTADAPAVFAVPSAEYGVQFYDITSAKTASPFVIQVTCRVPAPGVNNTYPLNAFSPDDPAVCGLRFSNGHMIAAATLGASNWGSGSGVSF